VRTHGRAPRFSAAAGARGFSLVELLVVVLLLGIAMLGILAVFDASSRINKSEQDVADAQGAVRYGIYQMTRAIRMAGAGGLFLTQSVLNRPDPDLLGITIGSASGYDNVTGATVKDLSSVDHPVRDKTDMIEVRGVLLSPLVSFDLSTGCGSCTGSSNLDVAPVTGCPTCTSTQATPINGKTFNGSHVNDNQANRPQFAAIDAYTAGATAGQPMFVIVSANDDLHGGCSTPFGPQLYPQPTYNVGRITAPTQLVASSTFGAVDFANAQAVEFNNENPADAGVSPTPLVNLRRGGILDDIVYFIDNTDPNHPALAQAIRRGQAFDITTIADDVEDMQIAYGVDINGDGAVTRNGGNPPAGRDTDLNTSTALNGDEWAPNVAGEVPWTTIQFQSDPLPGTFQHPGLPAAAHCPRLHGVMISLVARSKDPDPSYNGPTALSLVTMNAPAPGFSTTKYRRRVQTLRVNLRNFTAEQ
jgi:prepilin-type N-terminal cleavage/methylation domain-containing protein